MQKKRKVQQGFTLIELIVVITILGILAAFAVPRFIGIQTEARVAAVNGMAGGIRSAAALAHGKVLVSNVAAGTGVTISMDGATVALADNTLYPAATTGGILAAIQDYSGFNATPTAGQIVLELTGAPTPASCSVTYVEAADVADAPDITVTTTGC